MSNNSCAIYCDICSAIAITFGYFNIIIKNWTWSEIGKLVANKDYLVSCWIKASLSKSPISGQFKISIKNRCARGFVDIKTWSNSSIACINRLISCAYKLYSSCSTCGFCPNCYITLNLKDTSIKSSLSLINIVSYRLGRIPVLNLPLV